MKLLIRIRTLVFAAVFSCLTFPSAAYAATGQGHRLTIPQLLILALVMGWYLYNHFKDKIKALFRKNRAR